MMIIVELFKAIYLYFHESYSAINVRLRCLTVRYLYSNNRNCINNKEGELDEYVIACNVRQRCITNHANPIIPAVLVAQMVVVSCNKIFGKNTLNGSSYLRCLALPFFCNRPQFRKWKQQTREIIFLHALYPTTNIGHHG